MAVVSPYLYVYLILLTLVVNETVMVSHCPIEDLDTIFDGSATICGVTDMDDVEEVKMAPNYNYAIYHGCPSNDTVTRGRYVYLIDMPNIDLCELIVHGHTANVTFDAPNDICGKWQLRLDQPVVVGYAGKKTNKQTKKHNPQCGNTGNAA